MPTMLNIAIVPGTEDTSAVKDKLSAKRPLEVIQSVGSVNRRNPIFANNFVNDHCDTLLVDLAEMYGSNHAVIKVTTEDNRRVKVPNCLPLTIADLYAGSSGEDESNSTVAMSRTNQFRSSRPAYI